MSAGDAKSPAKEKPKNEKKRSRRATKQEKQERIAFLKTLLLKGHSPNELKDTAMQMFGVQRATAFSYVSQAKEQVTMMAEELADFALHFHISARMAMLKDADRVNDKLAILKDLAQIQGVYPDKKMILGLEQDIIMKLRDGLVDPMDVMIVYPNIADRLFLEAGVSFDGGPIEIADESS